MEKSVETGKLGIAGWSALVVLFGFLGWALWYAAHAWVNLGDVDMSTAGWVFLFMGVFFTLLIGGGLMALVFYSSRKDFDR